MKDTLGIVVAGGRGRRLGLAAPKALIALGGCTLLERAVRTLEPLCDELVIATSPSVPLDGGRHRVIVDAGDSAGPLAGVVTGLASTPHARALVLAVDLPRVGRELLAALLPRLGRHGAVIPVSGGRLQPLAAVYGPGAAEALSRARDRGVEGLIEAVRTLDPLLIAEEALGLPAGTFLNVNTPRDLAEARRGLDAAPAAGAGR